MKRYKLISIIYSKNISQATKAFKEAAELVSVDLDEPVVFENGINNKIGF